MISKDYWYSKEERRTAWQVFKYFISKEQLLAEEKNRRLFDRAKRISVDVYCSEHKNATEESVENALIMVARWENKSQPEDCIIDEKIEKLLFKSE